MFSRFWKWVTVDHRSWVAHGVNSVLFAAAFIAAGKIGGTVVQWWISGLTFSVLFFAHREWKDRAKYIKAGTWAEHKADGVGDFLAPVCLWIGAVSTFLMSSC